MTSKLLRGLRSVGAVIAGYLVIAVGTTLTFETWLGGIGYYKSTPAVLALATVGAFLSGLAGGVVAAWLGDRRPLLHATAVLVPLTLDTAYVLFSGISNDPFWFDLGGGATLMVAAVLGGFLIQTFQRGSRADPLPG